MLTFIANLLEDWNAARLARRQRRRAFAELSALDDRSLADIGISRSEIPYLLSQAPQPAARRRAPAGGSLRHAA